MWNRAKLDRKAETLHLFSSRALFTFRQNINLVQLNSPCFTRLANENPHNLRNEIWTLSSIQNGGICELGVDKIGDLVWLNLIVNQSRWGFWRKQTSFWASEWARANAHLTLW